MEQFQDSPKPATRAGNQPVDFQHKDLAPAGPRAEAVGADDFRRNQVTGKFDEPATTAETLALSDLIEHKNMKITLDQMRQMSRPQIEAQLTASVKLLLGPDPEFILENSWGDKRSEDEKGNVTSFTYVDRVGNELIKFDHVMRDADGKTISFSDSNGRRWENLRPDQYFEPDASVTPNKWITVNRATGERSQRMFDLGTVTFDKEGVHADGKNPTALNIPRRRADKK